MYDSGIPKKRIAYVTNKQPRFGYFINFKFNFRF